ncbi:MAG: carbamoyl-phosphate synthase large subunit, partial [Chitinivibrionales bacterium]|nr:carbamoyl-phosphate synthase large subunit [Chitinivibrionales bacterium]
SSLGVQMKSVGETMAVGRTFKEALQKGLRGLEISRSGLDETKFGGLGNDEILSMLGVLRCDRLFVIGRALRLGIDTAEIHEKTGIDPWFINNVKDIIDFEASLSGPLPEAGNDEQADVIKRAKQWGFSDAQLARCFDTSETAIRKKRKNLGIVPTYKLVDTCAAEFEACTPYYYSTYEYEDESIASDRKKIIILGGGPNRIGQGIEFDYCCCQASFALRDMGIESIMVNSNPETVSTDYDTSDKLYFEPLTFEDVMNIVDKEKPDGIIIQFGGQTPLNLARRLHDAGAQLIGTAVESIERAEDRDEFAAMCKKLGLKQPPSGMAATIDEALKICSEIGYPILLRPSFVLGGRAMRIIHDKDELYTFIDEAKEAGENRPVLIDKFIGDAIEVDVDALSDGTTTMICGIMEHIEEAGIHSGDSACVVPPYSLSKGMIEQIRNKTVAIASELGVVGLMNIQYAVNEETVYVLEVNPRASRTVPFVSKATGIPWAYIAAKVMAGASLDSIPEAKERTTDYFSVKESVLPFNKFPGADTVLGPEMKSTGEVMGVDHDFGLAFAKSQDAAGNFLPRSGTVFVSVRNSAKRSIIFAAKTLVDMGFQLCATEGTWHALTSAGINVRKVHKIGEGKPDIVDLIKANNVDLVINVPAGRKSLIDSKPIRSAAVAQSIPYITTLEGAQAAIGGMYSLEQRGFDVVSIQERAAPPKNELHNNAEVLSKKRSMWNGS